MATERKRTTRSTGTKSRNDKFNWKPGDVKVYKNLSELKKATKGKKK